MAYFLRHTIRAAAAFAGAAFLASLAIGQSPGDGSVPPGDGSVPKPPPTLGVRPIPVKVADVSALKLPTPSAASTGHRGKATGIVRIIVRLNDPPLAVAVGANAKRLGIAWSRNQQRSYLAYLNTRQDTLMAQIRALGGKQLARVVKAHNALVVQVPASRVAAIARLPGVAKVRPVIDYQLTLSETVPYIGAAALQAAGVDGSGITVAVLDTGIDYTHRNLGGPGTTAAYTAAYGAAPADPKNTTRDGLFPTAKVVEGFDFVGEDWPNSDEAPDPDPIDFQGHGSHVADIVAGLSVDNLHKGVAPGAKLLAIKVCSAVSTACSGIAVLQGVDFAVDPNGDGDLSDAADVMNLSLGLAYGQREDDLSEALANATRLGVVVVAAAGNDGDKPYVVGSPSSTPEVISVAQTHVPSALAYPLVINSPASIAGTYTNTATLDFAPIVGTTTGDVAFVGRGCPAAGPNPEDPYLANPAGKIALIDRGICAVSLKIDRAAQAGAIGVLIGLIAPGDAISFSYGGGTVFVPSLVITQSTSNLIKANIAAPVNATMSESITIPLVGSMASTSSRGPGYSYVAIKPDIGAPGASMSAEVGTGTGETAFGGTSGASPMVAGSAALLLDANPSLTPTEVKARLMNSAETIVFISPATAPGVLAPITRIGAGEVRVDRAAALTAAAWDATDQASVGLSYGYNAATGVQVLRKKVLVRNYAAAGRTFSVTPSFRYADDQASAAISFSAPPTVTVPGNGSTTFTMALIVNANNLPTWDIDGGPNGGNGPLLTGVEYDGYVAIADGSDTIRLPWHLLPHKAANVKPASKTVALGGMPTGSLALTNAGGAVSGRVDVFSLTGTSPQFAFGVLPEPGDNFAIIDLRAVGVRPVSAGPDPAVQFAINTFGARSHPVYPAEFDVYVDSDNNGEYDYVIFNSENGGFAATGQSVITVVNLATGDDVTRFFADASLNSANMIMTALLSDLALAPGQQFRFSVVAGDNYFTGNITDTITDMVYTLNTPRFTGSNIPAGGVTPGGGATLSIASNPAGATASPSQTGLLLMYRDAKPGVEADAITITP